MKINIYETLQNFFKNNRENNTDFINIDYEYAKTILKNDSNAILLDVRSPQEYRERHLVGSINVPLYNIEDEIEQKVPNKQNTLIVYCQSGGRSKSACKILIKKKYTSVYNIDGGLDAI